MVMEQYLQETLARTDSNKEHGASVEKWSSVSAPVDGSDNNPSCGGFDCNICLDSVQDPVVTLCGHLYCWPCIYKWIHFQSASAEKPNQQQRPQCPVCKAEVSQKTLVPLYGKGQTTKSSEGKAPNLGIVVPRRPSSPTCGVHTPITTATTTTTTTTTGSHPPQQLHHRGYPQRSQLYPSQPMIGEMVYARLFGNSANTLDSAYPNSYSLVGSSSPRVRRHMMKVDESLSRVCFFMFCCIVLCLVLF